MAHGFANIIDTEFAVQIDEVADSITYIGKAIPGSLTSAAVWQIYKIDESGAGGIELVVKWADGDRNYDNIWDNRESLDYS